MVSRVLVAALFLSTALTGFPAYAEPLTPSPQVAAVVEFESKTVPETVPAGLPALQPEIKGTPESAKPELPAVQAKPESTDVDLINLKYIKGYATDTGKMITSPLRWQSNDWLKFGLVIGGTTSLFLVDKEVKEFAQKNQSGVASKFASVGNFIGDPINMFPSVGAFYLYGYLADNKKARRASLLALESLTLSGVFTSGLKVLASRHRPNSGDGPAQLHGPTLAGKNVSFSSGHTSSAFAVATVIAEEYKDTPYAAPVAYGLATLTGLARIYSNEHWSSDAFFGAALGYFVSKAVLSYHKKDTEKQAKRLTVMPQVGKMTGVTVNYSF